MDFTVQSNARRHFRRSTDRGDRQHRGTSGGAQTGVTGTAQRHFRRSTDRGDRDSTEALQEEHRQG